MPDTGKQSQDRDERKKRREKSRHIIVYKLLTHIAPFILKLKFNYEYELFDPELADGPALVVANHSCAWDPVLLAAAFRKKHMYFVASEHILRWKLIGPFIGWAVAPIPRKKASSGAGTVMACLRRLKEGSSVMLFAEGEQSFNGKSIPIFPSTGKMAKLSGACLVTARIEGAYTALPRWAKGVRRGRVSEHIVNVYTPEQLESMSADEVTEAIDRDISFDVWKWQKQPGGPVKFRLRTGLLHRSKKVGAAGPARGLEKALYMCPCCGQIGTMTSCGDTISCSCGFSARYLETGFLQPLISDLPAAFTSGSVFSISDWDEWQEAELVKLLKAGSVRFTDPAADLSQIREGHSDCHITDGPLSMDFSSGRFVLSVGNESFSSDDIRMMSMVLSNLLLIKTAKEYYQIRAGNTNLRKYIHVWEHMGGI